MKVLKCENCNWTESELSQSGYRCAAEHQRLYKHRVHLIKEPEKEEKKKEAGK